MNLKVALRRLLAVIACAAGAPVAAQAGALDFAPMRGYAELSCAAGYEFDPAVGDCVELGNVPICAPNAVPDAGAGCVCLPGLIGDPFVGGCFEEESECPPNSSFVPETESCVCNAGFIGDPFEGGCFAEPTSIPSPTDIPTPTATATPTPTDIPTPTATATPTPTDIPTPTATATPTPTDIPTPTATVTLTPTDVPTPTATLTEVPEPTRDPCDTEGELPPGCISPTDIEAPGPSTTPAGIQNVPGSAQGPALPAILFVMIAGIVVLLIWARRART